MANSVDPDQMLHSAASDQGLHCLLKPVYMNSQEITSCGNFIFFKIVNI